MYFVICLFTFESYLSEVKVDQIEDDSNSGLLR